MNTSKQRAEPAPAWRVGPGGVTTEILTARPAAASQQAAATSLGQRVALRRRALLRGGFWAGMAVVAAGGLASTLELMNPRNIRGFGSIVTVPAPNVPKPGDEPYHFLEGKLWLVKLKPGEGVPLQFEAFGHSSERGGLLALYHKCVHLGCTVPWKADFEYGDVKGWFRCPCHMSTYSKAGVYVHGPATRSLDTFAITKVDQNGVEGNTGRITHGNAGDPQRAVPAGPFA
jgi:cytochrome b6-f complex iron-sulfur subunit